MASILNFATLHPIWFVLMSMLVSFLLLMLVFILSRGVSGGKEDFQMLALGTGQVLVGLAFLALIGGVGLVGGGGVAAVPYYDREYRWRPGRLEQG